MANLLLLLLFLGAFLFAIRDKGHLDDLTTRFYVACVVSALGKYDEVDNMDIVHGTFSLS